ncbi:hypothetical protein SDJN02_02996, partial [Cucurbita argyrosperma subsp. argyrosperma]
MSNLIQESAEPQNPEQQHFDSRFSTLCLNPGGTHHRRPPLCSSCGRRPPRCAATHKKRRSPTQIQDPTATTKKHLLDPKQHNLTSFSKIDLPIPFGPSSAHPTPFSPLSRSVSDPTEARNFSPPSPAKRLCPNSALPPLPLRRTVSDPTPSTDKTSVSPLTIGRVNDSIKEDSPDSKRLRKIKDRLKEMNEWWNEVMSEQEHEEEKRDEKNETKKKVECCKEEEDEEETVGVERVGDSLELRLKCPCGKGFEILLSGTSCFYKLL